VDSSDQDDETPDPGHWLLVIGVNLLILGELCAAMYFASMNPDNFTATFMKTFFGLSIPTLIVVFLLKRRLRVSKGDD